MMSNGKPQFVRQVFSLQSNGAAGEAGNAAVRQDKDRFSSDRVGTSQPASVNQAPRSHPTNPNSTRTHSPLVHKSRTVHLNLWISPIVKAELVRLAEQEGLSMSAAGAAFLEQALQQKIDLQYSALLQPIIESAIQKGMRAISTRLAWLLVRVAFDAGQTRSLVTNILGRQSGMTEENLKTILAMSQRTAKGNITRRTPQINELIEAVEEWLVADNGNSQGDLYKKQ